MSNGMVTATVTMPSGSPTAVSGWASSLNNSIIYTGGILFNEKLLKHLHVYCYRGHPLLQVHVHSVFVMSPIAVSAYELLSGSTQYWCTCIMCTVIASLWFSNDLNSNNTHIFLITQ